MIDSHCHLADQQFSKDLDEVVERAKRAGVHQMVCIADDLKEAARCIAIAEKYSNVYATAGVHPHHAKNWRKGDGDALKALLTSSSRIVALGEIGLDYHYDHSPRDVQQAVLEEQMLLGKEMKLPVVIHNRNSITDLMNIVNRVQPEKAVLHCCTEKWEDVQDWVSRGYMLSFTGIATYPKSEDIRTTIRECPLEQIMIETDAPYLAPVPHRGKRNEPSYVREVGILLAEIKKIPLEELDQLTTKNTMEFFALSS